MKNVALKHAIRRQAIEAYADRQDGVLAGIVVSVNVDLQTAIVTLAATGIDTSDLPIRTLWSGPGWGLYCPPTLGSVVDVHTEEGSLNAMFIGLRAWNDIDAPLPCPVGEFWIVHALGQFIKLTNSGGINSNGEWTHTGDFVVSKNVQVGAGATGSFSTPTGQTVTVQDGIVTNIF